MAEGMGLYKALNCAKLDVIARTFCTLRHLNRFIYALYTGHNADSTRYRRIYSMRIHYVHMYVYRIEREAYVHCKKMFAFLSGTQVDCKNSSESIVVCMLCIFHRNSKWKTDCYD